MFSHHGLGAGKRLRRPPSHAGVSPLPSATARFTGASVDSRCGEWGLPSVCFKMPPLAQSQQVNQGEVGRARSGSGARIRVAVPEQMSWQSSAAIDAVAISG